jgi:signal transduction histidine kinase
MFVSSRVWTGGNARGRHHFDLRELASSAITLEPRAAELNKQAATAAQAANEASQAKSEFLATISYEIRTPISGLLGMLGLILDSELSEEQHVGPSSRKDVGLSAAINSTPRWRSLAMLAVLVGADSARNLS